MDIGKEPVFKIFIKYAIPSIVGFFGMTIASVVDGIIVGRVVGSNALAAVNLTYPLAVFAVAVSLMISAGGTTLTAVYLGKGKEKEANNSFSITVALITAFSIFATVIFLIFINQLVVILGADEQLDTLVKSYALPLIPFFIFFMLTIVLEGFIRIEGRPNYGMKCLLAAVISNIILDLLFVAILKMELQGAALATGISQVISFVLLLLHYFSDRKKLHIKIPKFKSAIIIKILTNGSSEFAANLSQGVVKLIFNIILMREIGPLGVSAYSIVGYITMLTSIFIFGFGTAISPGISFNLGAKQPHRIAQFLRLGMIFNIFVGIMAAIVIVVFGDFFVSVFAKGNNDLKDLSLSIAYWYCPALVLAGINVIFSMYFTALQKALKSAVISFSSSLIMRIIFLLILPLFFGKNGIWMSVSFAEATALILALIFFKIDNTLNQLKLESYRE